MKSVYKLRKRLADKSRVLELLKNKYVAVLLENDKLKEEMKDIAISKTFKMPFTRETKHELFCLDHQVANMNYTTDTRDCKLEKCIEEDSTTFSMRFKPNVKFHCVIPNSSFANILIEINQTPMLGCGFLKTDRSGNFTACPSLITYENWEEIEVSIYEAVPELVPYCMFYDAESDMLVQKTCSNQMCQGEFCDCSYSLLSDDEKFESLLSKHSFHSRKS